MKIRTENGKEYVLCAWRRRYVRLTPEEHIRQLVLGELEKKYGYPHGLIAVEVPITVAGRSKRCDAIVYDQAMKPLMLIEFKAPTVRISQDVFDQAAIYNRHLNVPILMLCNGEESVVAEVHATGYGFLDHIPSYKEIQR